MALKDIHVTVQEETVRRLGVLAQALDASRNTLIRQAIEDYLVRKERELLDLEIDEYVKVMAPLSGEFVAETGDEVARLLLENTEW